HNIGTININNGTLIIKGDYRIQAPTDDGYTHSSGLLRMVNASDYVLVHGDFVIDTSRGSTSGSYFTAGVLEV
ncbi:hypothetical protein, partial [Pseudoalteromonas sp. SR41-7]|uniref:hypothetical protein n=1 Tax=Pseudoalteromonas sp. SR41-7 TaxID=2760947 RepID=UPI00160294F8